MLKNLFCSVGLHNWNKYFSKDHTEERKCKCCGIIQHNTYDMATGETEWAKGAHWSKKQK